MGVNQNLWKLGLSEGFDRLEVSRGGQLRRNTKKISAPTLLGAMEGLDSSGRSDSEWRMAVANAVGRRGSNCATAARLKSPMIAWRAVCDDYFRLADPAEVGQISQYKRVCQY
jgi:hypothetical protein